MIPKFERGNRVLIGTRPNRNKDDWENSGLGDYAIIRAFKENSSDSYEEGILYELLILPTPNKSRKSAPYFLRWFEENSLELICWNNAKGEALLAVHEK